jgi:hypothetical protein
VAICIAHTNWGDANQLAQFWKGVSIIGGGLAFLALGGGRYSVDGRTAEPSARPRQVIDGNYFVQTMATRSGHLEPRQASALGMAPVISSRSTLRKLEACA